MTQKNQIYKCGVCGNIVAVLHAGAGELVCCGQPMILQAEKEKDEGQEKHLPVLETLSENGNKGAVRIKIGEVPHPMESAHYIEWVEISTSDNKTCRKFLSPADQPEAEFQVSGRIIEARAYCNVHGLWKITVS